MQTFSTRDHIFFVFVFVFGFVCLFVFEGQKIKGKKELFGIGTGLELIKQTQTKFYKSRTNK